MDKATEGKTHAQRMAEIDDMEPHVSATQGGQSVKEARTHWQAHIKRLRLIYAPFPKVRRLGDGSAMPWAGTIVGDTFYGDAFPQPNQRGKYAGKFASSGWRETGDAYEWDDYLDANEARGGVSVARAAAR